MTAASPAAAVPRPLRVLGRAHRRVVHARRTDRLATLIAPLVAPGWSVLDVGCGDGRVARRIGERRGPLTVEGVEVRVRDDCRIPVRRFDGRRLPFPDDRFDAVLLVDVLHHGRDPVALLAEARRVARRAIIVKDHRLSRPLAGATLRVMDWVGNRPHGVPLPGTYWTPARWRESWRRLGLRPDRYETRLDLYPVGFRWLFDAGLHFLARLVPQR